MVMSALIWTRWPENFSWSSCFKRVDNIDINMRRCVQMRADGYNRVYDDGEYQKQVEKRRE